MSRTCHIHWGKQELQVLGEVQLSNIVGTTVIHKKDCLHIALIINVPCPEDLIDPPLEYRLVKPIVLMLGVREGCLRQIKSLLNPQLYNCQERTLISNRG